METKIIAILGCGRSGTSLTSQTLIKAGCGHGGQTQSTWEDTSVRAINEKFLKAHYNADHPSKSINFYGILPDHEIVVPKDTKEEMKTLADRMRARGGKYYCFKDPRSIILHHGWMECADIVVSIYRNPLEVCGSLCKMMGRHVNKDPEAGKKRMIDYWLRLNQSLIYTYKNYNQANYILKFDHTYGEQMSRLLKDLGLNNTNFYKPATIENKCTEIPDECLETWNELEYLRGAYS